MPTVTRKNTNRRLFVVFALMAAFYAGVFVLSSVVRSSAEIASSSGETSPTPDTASNRRAKIRLARQVEPVETNALVGGGTLAFDYSNGQIFAIDNVGGSNDVSNLTGINDFEPVFAKTGKKILYRSYRDSDFGSNQGELYTMNPDGYDQTRLTFNTEHEYDFAFSEGGTKIVYASNNDIWTINADGSAPLQIDDPSASLREPSFSPDGTKITFNRDGAIWIMDADGTNQSELSANGGEYPQFTPNGLKVIFVSGSNILSVDIDGSNETILVDGQSQNYDLLGRPVYSPDNPKLLMECSRLNDIGICVANANGTGLAKYGDDNANELRPVWSPNGQTIAFTRYFAGTNSSKIFTISSIGTSETEIYNADQDNTIGRLTWQPMCVEAPQTPSGLVSWWRAEGNADDTFGPNGGTFNVPAYAAGSIGQAFSFDGTGNFVEVPDSASLDVQTGNYTVAGWVRILEAREHYIFGKGACGGSSSNFYVGVDLNNVPFMDISHESGGTRAGNPTAQLGPGWHHLALRKQGITHSLFKDGSFVFNLDIPQTIGTNDAPFTIGKGDGCSLPQLTSNALIDEVYLFNRDLTDTEIDSIYQNVDPPAPCPPVTSPVVEVRVLHPHPVAAGRATQGRLLLATIAPPGGASVSLTSTDPSVMTVPTTVVVPEGFIHADFPITTTVDTNFRSADVIATLGPDTARATVTVAPAAPDVAGSNIVAPPTVSILQNFAASWDVTNVGEAATESYREDDVWISADDVLFNDPNDRFIGRFSDNNGILAVNQSKTMSVTTVNIPSIAIPTDGPYYMFVHVGVNVRERLGDSQNNYTSIPIQVNRNLPDLIAENIQAPAEVEPGVQFSVTWDVRNQGSAAATPAHTNNLYISFDTTVGNADDVLITQRAEGPFAIGQTASYSQLYTIPTLPLRVSSDAFVYVTVDVSGQVFEDEPGRPAETNNTTTRAIRWEYRVPDLVVQSVTPPVDVESDTTFALRWTSQNAGLKNAGFLNEQVYFSTDNVVDANDTLLGTFVLPSGINAGQSVNRIQNVLIPTNAITATGDYFVYVKTDSFSQVDEGAFENNNVTFSPLRVRRLLRPDLQVTNITAPATAFFDQEIQVQWTTANNGAGPTNSPSWNDELLLGVNQTLSGANRLSLLPNVSYLDVGESYIASATVRIPRGANGSYFLIVRTDRNGTVNEENENNNLETRPITINVPILPDLRVSNVQAPAEGFAGQPIAVSWTVTNHGDGATPANESTWFDAIYISQNTTLDANDPLIGTRQRSGVLAASGTYTVSNFNVNLPGYAFGNYYVFVVADVFNYLYEFSAENNNNDYDRVQPGSPMNVLGTPPDLIVPNTITAPTNATAGTQVAVQFTVRNQGAFDATGFWHEGIYISADQTLNPVDDPFLGSVRRDGLPAGQEYGAAITVTIPNCLQGTYYLFAVTDVNKVVSEFDPGGAGETNNTSQPKAIALTNLAPDLRITQMTVPPVVTNGAMPMSWSVKNFGAGATVQTSWWDRVFVNTGSQIVTLGNFQRNGALAVNGEYTQNQVVNLPNFLEGSFQIIVRTDVYSNVPECAFDSNNDDFRPTTIQQDLPDMRITGVNSPPAAILGSTFDVTWTGQNLGTAFTSAATWSDTVYLSNDATLQVGDRPIGSLVNSGSLANGATYPGQTAVTIPNVPVGNYYLIVGTDSGNHIEEGVDENNNGSTAMPITLSAPQVDLQPSNVSANPILYTGQITDVSWTVTNIGVDPTTGSNWVDHLILSRDSVYDQSDAFLGFRARAGSLNGGANYNQTHSIVVPTGLTGDYTIFVIADRHNQITENNEANNISPALNVTLALPPPAEFNITNITPPASITLGDPTTFSWTVQNSSANASNGVWQDSVYLSTDTIWDSGDFLVGAKARTGSVAPFATYTETLNAPIPPIEIGTYYVIVRTDSRNSIRESIETNNVASSVGQTIVGVTNLTLGTPVNTTLVTGQERFYSIFNTPLNETMLVSLTGENGSKNELYTRGGSMVSRSNYEFQGDRQGEANQENVVPNTTTETYYTMIRGDYVPNSFAPELMANNKAKKAAAVAAEAVTIKAEILPFGVRRISPSTAGNLGHSTVLVEGAKFQQGATLRLVAADNSEIAPQQIAVGTSKIAAVFDLKGKAIGSYDVVVRNPDDQTSTLSDGFQIINGGGHRLRSNIIGASETRPGVSRYIFSASNDGLNDAINVPILIQFPTAYSYQLDRGNFFDLPESELPAGTPPSQVPLHIDIDGVRTLLLYAPILRSGATIEIGVDLSIPINFGGFKVAVQMLPPLSEFVASSPPTPQSPASVRTYGPVVSMAEDNTQRDCWAEVLRQAIFAILGELLPTDDALKCLSAGWGSLLSSADFASALILKGATGNQASGFDQMGAIAGKLMNSFGNLAINCAGLAIPWFRMASVAISILQLVAQIVDCLKNLKTELTVTSRRSFDPNEKLGPDGYGIEKFVSLSKPLLYRINFENLASANAPAQRIRIVDQLPATLDPRTLRLVEIGFKQYKMHVPGNRAFYQTRLQLGEDLNNLQAEISAGLNITNGTVTWNFTAIDPQTNEQPVSPLVGLLPPNNEDRDGEGYVTFTILPTANQPTRTDLANSATIFFDDNEPIVTNTTMNLLDADVPVSQCSALPATSDTPSFDVSWAGTDDSNGSGLKSFDVFVSENGGNYFPFISDTTAGAATFNGKFGRNYRFYSVARDNAGNIEASPVIPDASITVRGGAFESDVSPRPDGDNNGVVDLADVGQVRRFAGKLDTSFQYNELQRADSAPLADGGNGVLTVADVIQARRFELGLDEVRDSAGVNSFGSLFTKSLAGRARNVMLPREIRATRVSRTGNKVTIGIDLESQGDEAGAGFTLNFDTAVLNNPANISLGSGAVGASLTINTSETGQGKVGFILDKAPNQPFAGGTRQLVTVEFDVAAGAPSSTQVGFDGAQILNEVVDSSALSLTTTFSTSTIVLMGPTASAVSIKGRVARANGSPISGAVVTLSDVNGRTRSITTNTFGRFAFNDVQAGQSYIVGVYHRRYRFEPATMILNVEDNVTDLVFRSLE